MCQYVLSGYSKWKHSYFGAEKYDMARLIREAESKRIAGRKFWF
jgi:hypothetical protein